MADVFKLELFRAKLGTTFRYRPDLSGEIYIQLPEDLRTGHAAVSYRGTLVTTVQIPAIDFLEFAAHVAGLPPWAPEKDAFDQETIELMMRHADNCQDCGMVDRCETYWLLVLERTRLKRQRTEQ